MPCERLMRPIPGRPAWEQHRIYRLRCCIDDCQATGPEAGNASAATFNAIMQAWEVVFGLALCPSCNEAGRLPEDTRLAIAPDRVARIVSVDDDDEEDVP